MKIGISLEEALELIRVNTIPLAPARAAGQALLGRTLAEDVTAPMSLPPFARSPLDGYALIAADTAGAGEDFPTRLEVIDTVYAGGWCDREIRRGQCVRIMTGAPIPRRADCVVRQEDTDQGTATAAIYRELQEYENYCFAGEDCQRGDILLKAGTVIDAAALGLLASAGLWKRPLSTYPNPSILLLATGDELAALGLALDPGQIYDSNLPQLSARCRQLEADIHAIHCPDDPQAVAEALWTGARNHDCIITTGGVSVGEKDVLHEALPLAGAEQIFRRVQLKPGSPLMFSLLGGKPVLSLSGNPFAAAATFELFARPMLAALAGQRDWAPTTVTAPLSTPFPKASGQRRFIRGRYENEAITLPEGHSSGQLRSSVGCNCLVDIPAGSPPLAAGDMVKAVLLWAK